MLDNIIRCVQMYVCTAYMCMHILKYLYMAIFIQEEKNKVLHTNTSDLYTSSRNIHTH